MDLDLRALERFFTYHPPHGDQTGRYQKIRSTAKEFAVLIYEECPDSDERSKAVECLRETVLWANAAIACNE